MNDVIYACRLLRASRGYAVLAMLTLALGISIVSLREMAPTPRTEFMRFPYFL
jgi:hypothetical protein